MDKNHILGTYVDLNYVATAYIEATEEENKVKVVLTLYSGSQITMYMSKESSIDFRCFLAAHFIVKEALTKIKYRLLKFFRLAR